MNEVKHKPILFTIIHNEQLDHERMDYKLWIKYAYLRLED